MFIKNLTQKELVLKKSGKVLKLKPGMNCIEFDEWTISELKKIYGPQHIVFVEEEVKKKKDETEAEEKAKAEAEEKVRLEAEEKAKAKKAKAKKDTKKA